MTMRMNKGLELCLLLVLLGIFGAIHAAKEDAITEESVITLDHTNFSDSVSKHDFIVVEFYAPWCGHCKHLAPEYEKAASVLSKHDPPITLAKVDAADAANTDLATQYDINGFPTLKIFRNGGLSVQQYNGPRDAEGIVKYVRRQYGPASVEIKSADDASRVIDENKIFIAGVFPIFSGEEYENFMKLAEKLRSDYDFGHTLDAKVLPKGDSSIEGPIIRLLKPFDELFADFKNFHIDAVEKFIEAEDAPSVVEFDMNNPYLSKFFSSNNIKVSLLLNFSSENAAALKSKFFDIAYLFKGGNFSFLVGDVEPSKRFLQYYKLEESQAPLIFVEVSGDNKYLKTHVEPDQVVLWFKKFLEGKVQQFKASQPIPQENNEPVKVIVLDSLDNMVFNSQKEVLLEFYAPWCGHCQKLAPVLDEVAISYEKDPNILIAKYDATANDVPSDKFNFQGFPTMYFINANNEIIEYNGGREKQDIVNFIEEHRTSANTKSTAEINNVELQEPSESVDVGGQHNGAASTRDELR